MPPARVAFAEHHRTIHGSSRATECVRSNRPPLIAVDAIVRVDSAELELHVDAVEGDPLMVSIESEGNGDAGGEPPQQQLVGRRSRVSPPAPSGSSPPDRTPTPP